MERNAEAEEVVIAQDTKQASRAGDMTFVTQSAAVVKNYEKQSVNPKKLGPSQKSKSTVGGNTMTNRSSAAMLKAASIDEGDFTVDRTTRAAGNSTVQINQSNISEE